MKILINSYNKVFQNEAGGVQMRIKKFFHLLNGVEHEVKLFDKWNDNISDYDILHTFKLSLDDYQLIAYAKSKGIPIVISSVVPQEGSLKIKINLWISKLLPIHTAYYFSKRMLDMADVIVAQTNKESEFISTNYKVSKAKIKVIPNGVSIENNVSDIIFSKINIHKPYVLQVGRFDENKNQINVIRALKNSNIPVVFIGGADPSDLEYYELCKKEATDNMFFLGWIKNDDPILSSAYANAQVVVLPSHKEIFGNSLIEGGAYGANLVVTDELPIYDWGIGDYCNQINPKDIVDIKNKIKEAFYSSKNDKLKTIINEKFSWNTILEEHINLYRNIIKT